MMNKYCTLQKAVLASVSAFITMILPDNSLGQSKVEELKIKEHLVRSIIKGTENYRTFSKTNINEIFKFSWIGDDEHPGEREIFTEMLNAQIPDALKAPNRNAPIFSLELEACGPFPDQYGITGEYIDNGWIDETRINMALSKAGLNQISRSKVDQLRMDNAGSGFINDKYVVKRPSLKEMNNELFQKYQDKQVDRIFLILDYSEGCGAGEIEVKVDSDPKMTNIQMIPDFYFTVCKDLYTDPWSKSDCRFWNPAPAQMMVSGVYQYKGILANGEAKRGSVNVDLEAISSSNSDSIPTLVLR